MSRDLFVSLSRASVLKFQALWYLSFITVYVWFMYWVACDFFVWHKSISEVNPVNYVGAITAIALIWAGTKILKPDRIKASSQQQNLLPPQSAPQPKQPPQKPIPQKPQQKAALANSTCTHYLGYLNQRQKQQEIPAECFTCEHIIKCMGSTN